MTNEHSKLGRGCLVVLAIATLILMGIGLYLWRAADAGAEPAACHVTSVLVWDNLDGTIRLATTNNGSEATTYITYDTWSVAQSSSSLNTACTNAHQQIVALALATLAGQSTWQSKPNQDVTFESPSSLTHMYSWLLAFKTRRLTGVGNSVEYNLITYFNEVQVGGDYANDWLTHVHPAVQETAVSLAKMFVGEHTLHLPIVTK